MSDNHKPAEFFRAILEHSQDLVAVADAEGRLVYSSPAVRRILGYDPAERTGGSIWDLVHPDDVPDQEEVFRRAVETPGAAVSAEFRARHRDGSWRVLQLSGVNLLDHPVLGGMLVTIRDVTELRAAEKELVGAQELLREVVDYAPVVLWKLDADGVFELSEGRGLEELGLEPGQVVGKNVVDVYGDDPAVREMIRTVLDGEPVEVAIEVGGRVFDTRVRPIPAGQGATGAVGVALDVTEAAREAERSAFRAHLLENVGQAVMATDPEGRVIYWNHRAEEMYGWTASEALGRALASMLAPEPASGPAGELPKGFGEGPSWSGECSVLREDGTRFVTHLSMVDLVEDGDVAARIGVSTDISDLKKLEAKLRRAQKMEAVGQLAAGIAHDFNNHLTAIGGHAALAADRTSDPGIAADLAEVMRATDRARGLAGKLMALSREPPGRLEPVNVNVVLRQVAPALRRAMGGAVRLEMEMTDEPWPIHADPALIEQVVVNLATNAREAMCEDGTFSLSTARVTLDEARIRDLELNVEPGDYMRVVATDTGGGMDPVVQERIFEPFFTTKEVGAAAGLGLSLVYGVVEQVGGGIAVESEPGAGTRFALYLPRFEADEDSGGDPGGGPAAEPARVLVVEDEPAVRKLAVRALEREGYHVLEAADAVEARRIIANEPATDLVLTDVIMPGMSGPALIQELRTFHPGIRTLFMSGYAADELEMRGLHRDQEHFLPKPFTPADLTRAVRRALAD